MNAFWKRVRSWRLLPPADKEFYKLFEEAAGLLVAASGKLQELFDGPPSSRHEIGISIETCFAKCNQVAKSLDDLLISSQQPPFERSEIAQFAADATRVMKYINHAANRFLIYDIPTSDKEMRELAPIIREACEQIDKAVGVLSKSRKVEPFCALVNQLEDKADIIYHGGLRRRFKEIREDRTKLETQITSAVAPVSSDDMLAMIGANVEYTRHVAIFFILRQVYAEMERATDACTELAETLKRMVAENV